MKKKTESGNLREALTEKQKAQREKDCTVKYGRSGGTYPDVKARVEGLVQEKWEGRLDAERREMWMTEDEVMALPSWGPSLSPAVGRVIGASSEAVAKFMTTSSREERARIVKRLTTNICKVDQVLGAKLDAELVESLVWRQLFDLQKDQGVVLRAEINKMTKS